MSSSDESDEGWLLMVRNSRGVSWLTGARPGRRTSPGSTRPAASVSWARTPARAGRARAGECFQAAAAQVMPLAVGRVCDDQHGGQRDQCAPSLGQRGVVLHHEAHDVLTGDEPQSGALALDRQRVAAVRAKRDEQGELAIALRPDESLHVGRPDGPDQVLTLHLDQRGLDTQRVAVGDDISSAVLRVRGHARLVAKGPQKVSGELLELLVAEVPVQVVQHEVTGVPLDAGGSRLVRSLLVRGRAGYRRDDPRDLLDRVCSIEGGLELAGVLADAEYGEERSKLVQRRLREHRARQSGSLPVDAAAVPVRFRVRDVFVVASDDADIDGAVGLVRGHDDVAWLHLVPEPGQDAGPAGDRTRLAVRKGIGKHRLECFSAWRNGAQIPKFVPADADEPAFDKLSRQGVVVHSPHLGHADAGSSALMEPDERSCSSGTLDSLEGGADFPGKFTA